MRRSTPDSRRREAGFSYLALLIVVAVLGVGLTAASEVWTTVARRQRMEQLEWAGNQLTQAIGRYYDAAPGSVKVYPQSLQDLVEDKRYLTMKRHLRQLYANPFTGKFDWQEIRAADGRIRGVRVVVQSDVGELVREFVYQPTVM